jgi:hypothetical protein
MRFRFWWFGVRRGAARTWEETWPVWVMGLIGGALVIGGLVVLIRGW